MPLFSLHVNELCRNLAARVLKEELGNETKNNVGSFGLVRTSRSGNDPSDTATGLNAARDEIRSQPMIRLKGRWEQSSLHLEQPLSLPEGTEVVVEIRTIDEATDAEWRELGMQRLEAEWDNPTDAVYDNWKELYGV